MRSPIVNWGATFQDNQVKFAQSRSPVHNICVKKAIIQAKLESVCVNSGTLRTIHCLFCVPEVDRMVVAMQMSGLTSSVLCRPTRASARFLGTNIAAPSNGSKVFAKKEGNWLPGSDTPAYLDELPASYGFDPLGLAAPADLRSRFQEAELIHSRWAMAGVAGALAVELAGQGNWITAQTWAREGGSPTFLGIPLPFNFGTILALNFILIAGAETRRTFAKGEEKKYPGGAFDPLGWSKGDLEDLKVKELKNGRLAMLAFLGFVAQYGATGEGPIKNLGQHLANPWANNFATNGVSIPGL